MQTTSDSIVLNYRHTCGGSDWRHMDYPVRLEWTDCTLGGQRAWMLCPTRDCARRVALLYIGNRGVFACRKCYHLAYASQRETVEDRAARRANRIGVRLGWDIGTFTSDRRKPKGMHWRTFNRLREAHDRFTQVSLQGTVRRLSRLGVDLANKGR